MEKYFVRCKEWQEPLGACLRSLRSDGFGVRRLRKVCVAEDLTISKDCSIAPLAYVVIEYGITLGSKACQINGIPWLSPFSSNDLELTFELKSSIVLLNLSLADLVCEFVLPRKKSPSNIWMAERLVPTKSGRANRAPMVSW